MLFWFFEPGPALMAPLRVRLWDVTKAWQDVPFPGAANKIYFHLQPAVEIPAGHTVVVRGLAGVDLATAPSVSYNCPPAPPLGPMNSADSNKAGGRGAAMPAAERPCVTEVSPVKLDNISPSGEAGQVTATECGDDRSWQRQCVLSQAQWSKPAASLTLTTQEGTAMQRGTPYIFAMHVTNGMAPQLPPKITIEVSSVGGFSASAEEMGAAPGYSDARALYIVDPIPVAAHVGCHVELPLRVREGAGLYTVSIEQVYATEEEDMAAAAAAAAAEVAAHSASSSLAQAADIYLSIYTHR